MAVTEQNIIKIAKLARLRMYDGDVAHYTKELNGIVHWIEQLQEVNTDGVEQMTSVADLALPWRADVVTDGNKQEQILKNAPASDYGCFLVPKVIE